MQRIYRLPALLLLLPLLFLTPFALAQQVNLSATNLSFAPQLVGSTAQVINLTGTGN